MSIKPLLLFSFFVIFACTPLAQEEVPVLVSPPILSVPINIAPDTVPYLRNIIQPDFQQVLQNAMFSNERWKRLIQQKKMAIGVVDLSNPYQPQYARLNGNVMMYAASLPKIAILLAVMDGIEKGEITETPELQVSMRQMISRSSNSAATELIDLVGFENIEKVLKSPEYDLYDEQFGGGLWVGKRYAKTGERRPDPLKGISHGATVTQVCRFYYMMAYGKLVSPERSSQMLDYMDNPEINHKFVNTLKKRAPKAHLYRKSGTWQNFHADSVLVWGPERRYILVVLLEDADGESILRNVASVIDNMLNTHEAGADL